MSERMKDGSRDAALDEQIKGFDAAMKDVWPPMDVVTLCAVVECGQASTETGFCAKDEARMVKFFADHLQSSGVAADAPAGWFQRSLLYAVTAEQAECLKLAVLAELCARFSPAVMLHRIPAAEVAAMCKAPVAVLDEPANRERRAALMSSLPRVQVPDDVDPALVAPMFAASNAMRPGDDFRLRFGVGCLIVLVALALLFHR
jgi:hypothetical protein